MEKMNPKNVNEPVLTTLEQEIEDHAENFIPLSSDERVRIESVIDAVRGSRNYRISLDLSDDNRLHEQASAAGVPCQTFAAEIIHKYLAGKLVDKAV